ncbi:MAG TPA: nickel pincer cofactor biosynthesis protein LarC [Vicinamibacterales bacterium]|nr:nickel pincer cofactor biosynthesis protein LarC [Vicinamibacterales bacterium]
MKTLYFDCFSGAAGDMILGALIDAGLPLADLKRALGSLGVEDWDISADRVVKVGITATKFRVHEHPAPGTGTVAPGTAHPALSTQHSLPHKHYHLAGIKKRIDQSALSETARTRAKALFDRLAEAEASVHSMPVEKVHLHEVGALDSIIDIVGTVFAMEWFGADRVVVSPLNVGGGTVHTAHGLYPVPAPATLRLLGEAPVYGDTTGKELLTPTGALLLSDYATSFGPLPAMKVDRIGYGAGDRDLDGRPNVLRVVIGDQVTDTPGTRVAVVECEIDDMNPQIFGALMDRLYAAGALDVFYSSVQMKKNRPGTLMTIIGRPADRDALIDLVFRETTTIGVRHSEVARECLAREMVTVTTPIGKVRFKVASRNGDVLNAQPEFDDVLRLATEQQRPIKDVQALAAKAWLER